MSSAIATQDVDQIPLDELDVSQASLFQDDTWRPYFARLRRGSAGAFSRGQLERASGR